MSTMMVWAAVVCLAGAIQAAPPPWEGIEGLLPPNTAQVPPQVTVYAASHLQPLAQKGQLWLHTPFHSHPTAWLRQIPLPDSMSHHAVAKRHQEILSVMNQLPRDHEKEMVKRAISLWVTLHPLTAVPSIHPPVSAKDMATNSRRPYGQRLRWGR